MQRGRDGIQRFSFSAIHLDHQPSRRDSPETLVRFAEPVERKPHVVPLSDSLDFLT
jgi:hypothetical protein